MLVFSWEVNRDNVSVSKMFYVKISKISSSRNDRMMNKLAVLFANYNGGHWAIGLTRQLQESYQDSAVSTIYSLPLNLVVNLYVNQI